MTEDGDRTDVNSIVYGHHELGLTGLTLSGVQDAMFGAR